MLDYRIDRTLKLVLVHPDRTLTADDIFDLQDQLRCDPAFDPGYALLADLRGATTRQLDTRLLREIAVRSPFAPAARRAFIVRTDTDFGTMRMLQSYSEFVDGTEAVGVFRDPDSAMSWLMEAAAPASRRAASAV